MENSFLSFLRAYASLAKHLFSQSKDPIGLEETAYLFFLRNTNVYPTSNRKKVVVLDEMKRHFRKFTKIQRQCDTSFNSHCHDADTSHLNNSEQSVFDESLQISKHTHSCPSVLPRASTPDLKDSSVGVDGAAPYNGISPAECTGTKDMTLDKSDLDISSVSVIGESSLCDKNKSVPAVLNTCDADKISVLSQSVGYVIKNGKLFLQINIIPVLVQIIA